MLDVAGILLRAARFDKQTRSKAEKCRGRTFPAKKKFVTTLQLRY